MTNQKKGAKAICTQPEVPWYIEVAIGGEWVASGNWGIEHRCLFPTIEEAVAAWVKFGSSELSYRFVRTGYRTGFKSIGYCLDEEVAR